VTVARTLQADFVFLAVVTPSANAGSLTVGAKHFVEIAPHDPTTQDGFNNRLIH
jgi:hypothetical protein